MRDVHCSKKEKRVSPECSFPRRDPRRRQWVTVSDGRAFFLLLFNFRCLAFWIRCKEWVGLVFIAKRQSCWHGCFCHVGSDVAWVIWAPKAVTEHLGWRRVSEKIIVRCTHWVFVRGEFTIVPLPLRRISGRCPSCSGVIENHPQCRAIVAIMHYAITCHFYCCFWNFKLKRWRKFETCDVKPDMGIFSWGVYEDHGIMVDQGVWKLETCGKTKVFLHSNF